MDINRNGNENENCINRQKNLITKLEKRALYRAMAEAKNVIENIGIFTAKITPNGYGLKDFDIKIPFLKIAKSTLLKILTHECRTFYVFEIRDSDSDNGIVVECMVNPVHSHINKRVIK